MRPRIVAVGDSAMLVRLGDTIDPATNDRALRIAHDVRARAVPGVQDIVVGYASVTVYYDPLHVDAATIEQILRGAAEHPAAGTAEFEPRRLTIPVAYGGETGPDLTEVAAFAGCSDEDVIALHTGREYRVYLIGFLPGFPYMGPVDERIAMPRREAPRLVVPAGSVGIAGRQTGIYPVESPGGWRLIGRTTQRMFDASRPSPSLLKAGDLVRFVRT